VHVVGETPDALPPPGWASTANPNPNPSPNLALTLAPIPSRLGEHG